MSVLEGFKTFNFNEGVPYVSLTKNGLTFNKSVVMKLDYPEFVLLLINADERKIAIKKCTEDTPNSVSFYKKNEKRFFSVRWNARDLLNTLQDMAGWDLSKESYRIDGNLIKEEGAMLFDFTNAKLLS